MQNKDGELMNFESEDGMSGFGATKDGMITMMIPLIHEIGREELRDKTFFNKFYMDLAARGITDWGEKFSENVTWGIVAIKKYKISYDEAFKHVLDGTMLSHCFEMFTKENSLNAIPKFHDLTMSH